MARRKSKGARKAATVMHEYSRGKLHSGRSGRIVKSRKQAIAIAMSEKRRVSRKGRRGR